LAGFPRWSRQGRCPDHLTATQRRDLRETVENRHGRGSILITCQLPLTAWHAVIDEPTFADAILDRLIHNAHRLELDGHSMRRSGSPAENVDEGQRA
jgi:DNA replication protein DnaC